MAGVGGLRDGSSTLYETETQLETKLMPPMSDQEDLYDDSPAASGKAPDAPKKDEGETTALLDKSILAGKPFEVGDEVVLKIVAMHDNEIEVAYAPEKPHDEEAEKKGEMSSMKEPAMANESGGNPGGLYD